MAIQLHWYAQGRVVEIEIDGAYTPDDVRLLDAGLTLYLNVTPYDRIHCILDGQLTPHCMLLNVLHHAKIGWVVERSAHHSPFGKTHRFYNAPSTQEALLVIANLESQAPTASML